nr:MAG TPA: hypothetical protein [Caudoviricetes sp.]
MHIKKTVVPLHRLISVGVKSSYHYFFHNIIREGVV